MHTSNEQISGNLSIVEGALYGDRRGNDAREPILREPAKQRFARRVRQIAATWKANDGGGTYPSRAVANTAHGIQWPLNKLHDQMESAIASGVPLERVEEMGLALIEEARALHRETRRLRPAA